MAADLKTKYPSINTVPLTCVLTSMATDATLLAGRASSVVDNTTNLDLDHLVSGVIKTGTSPTANTTIELWIYAHHLIVSGTPSYPDSITGTDANKTMTSANVKAAALIRAPVTLVVDSTSARSYFFAPFSIAALFGGSMPPYWGLFVVHNTGVNLSATSTDHVIAYERVLGQQV